MNTKERLEKFLSDTPIKPVMRTTVEGKEVYVADGFVTPDMYLGLNIKFAVPIEKQKYPNGCYATVWHAEGNPAGLSGVAYFESLHDIENISLNSRQDARINKTLELARLGLRKTKH